jgi:hypothetical protein
MWKRFSISYRDGKIIEMWKEKKKDHGIFFKRTEIFHKLKCGR